MKVCKNCGKQFRARKGLATTQEDCSEGCLADRFSKLARRTKKIARIYAKTLGYRSMFEVRFKALCNIHKLTLAYEVKTVDYQHKIQKYTADFTESKKDLHIECKGVLDAATRRKLLAVKRCNPDLQLILVFEKPNNKLSSISKTRYWQWAEQKGFPWYDWREVKNLKAHITKGKGDLK